MISVVLFSKDRPLQTQSFIESLLFHSEINQSSIYILYKAHQFISYETLINKYPNITWIRETNFYEDLLNILQKAEDYILWGCDDVFYKSNFDINTCLTALDANENILAFSLRLGENIHPNPGDSLIKKDNYLMWDWTESNFPHPSHPQEVSDWGYPWEVSASIYRKADIYTFFNWIEPPQSPNYLEGDLATIFKNTRATQSRKYLACFPLSKALTLTVNRVQHTHRNVFDATKDTSPNQLYQYFSEGYKLNWSKFKNCDNSKIHVGSEYFAIEEPSNKNQQHKKTPLVSVICRTYNRENFIEETIISVLSQTFTDFEFLILDDGSTDKTREILEKYIHDPRIKYVYQENIGKNLDAFHELTNRCIALSEGELVAIIDSDDICLPNRLERQVEEFKTDPDIDIVFSDGYHIDVNGNTLSSDFRFKESLQFNELNLPRLLVKKNIIPNPTVMIKRKAIEIMGGFEGKGIGEDYHFWLKSAPFLKFKYIDDKLVKYRIHPESSSTGVGSQQRVFQESVKILWQIRNKFSIFDLYPEIYGCQYRHNALYSAYLHFGNIVLTGNFPIPQMAVQEYQKALKNNGQGIEALNNLAVALWLTGEQLNSLQIFQYLKNSTAYQIEIVKHNIDLAEQLHEGNVVDNQNFILLNEQIESSNLLQVIETVNCPPAALSIPSSMENYLESEFDLGEINLIIVPDLEQSEESLYQDLAEIIPNILTYQEKSKIKLWVYNNDIEEEDAQILISDIVFHLLMDEELNLSEEPTISLIGNLSDQSSKLFLQQIQGRIILSKENQAVLQKPEFKSIVSYHPQQLVDILHQLINVYPLVSVKN
ncbi:MAG: glycosyltransferase [Nostocales cyanobacterium ELA583]|jgi:glycosyltransferase involved in cell wall biosynthesis